MYIYVLTHETFRGAASAIKRTLVDGSNHRNDGNIGEVFKRTHEGDALYYWETMATPEAAKRIVARTTLTLVNVFREVV